MIKRLKNIYSVYIGVLPLLMFVRFPFTDYGFGTVFTLLLSPFAVFCLIKERRKFNTDYVWLIVFFAYILIRSINSKSDLLLYFIAFVHIICAYASIEWKILKKTIVATSVIASFAIFLQRFLLLFGLKVSLLINPILLDEFAKTKSVYYGKTFVRTSGLFIEPSHFAEYALIALILLLISAKGRKVRKTDYLQAFIIALAILASTSGIGIFGLAGLIVFYILFVGFGEKQPVYQRFLILIIVVLLGFGLMYLIPTTRYSLIRIWGKVGKYNAVWGRTTHLSIYMNQITGIIQWIFGKGASEFEHYLLGFAKLIYQYGLVGFTLMLVMLGSFVAKKNRTVIVICVLYCGFLFSTSLVRFLNFTFYFCVICSLQYTFRDMFLPEKTGSEQGSKPAEKRKKIGLVTYSNYNYGSALQCYATQKYLSGKGAECVLIERNDGRIEMILDQIYNLFLNGIMSPDSIKKMAALFKGQRAKSLTLSEKSLKAVAGFRDSEIRTECFSYEDLQNEACSREYDYFLTGSDQVWNGERIDRYDMFFLRFAPEEKRVAWAPSFGGESIAKYNHARYRKYIGRFSRLSVRENSGRKIIYDLTKREADVLCDPVMLLSADEWRNCYRDSLLSENRLEYILAFFIDEPSDIALSMLQRLGEDNKEIISFGYNYKKYDALPGHRHTDGSPFDFLYMVDHASLVVTDSYHATVYSALFHTGFLSYERNYLHGQNQSVRIKDFLKETGLEERWETGRVSSGPGQVDLNNRPDFDSADSYFERMREKAEAYINPLLLN